MSKIDLELNQGTIGFELSDEYFSNEKYFSHQDIETVKVWVESENDKNLWNSVLPNSTRWSFDVTTTELFNNDQKMATGCDRIQKLIEIGQIKLGKNSIACIDSDFSRGINYLLVSNSIEEKPFWYTTIVHSMENIIYSIDNIVISLSKCLKVHTSKVSEFVNNLVKKLSKLLFKPFVLNLTCFQRKSIDKKEFDNFITEISMVLKKIHTVSNADSEFKDIHIFFDKIMNNEIWEEIETELNIVFNRILSNDNDLDNELDAVIDHLKNNNILEENIYLFFRGHYIEEIFSTIFQKTIDVKKRGEYFDVEEAAKKINEDGKATGKRKEQIGNSFLRFKPTASLFPLNNFENIVFFNQTYHRLKNEYI